MKRIVFRADGNPHIGLGHLIRCTALAEMLSSDFRICFIVKNSGAYIHEVIGNDTFELLFIEEGEEELNVLKKQLTPYDILVADGYDFNLEWQRTVRQQVSKLILIDDLMYTQTPYADVIINHAPGLSFSDYNCPPSVRLLLGPDYALLRPAFFCSDKKTFEQKSGIVLTMGGADPDNLTGKIVTVILNHTQETVTVLLGAAYVHSVENFKENERVTLLRQLKEKEVELLFSRSKLIISSASTVSMEACMVGTPLIAGLIADNQQKIYDGLITRGCALPAAWYKDIEEPVFSSLLKQALTASVADELMLRQALTFDGKSKERLQKFFKMKNIHFRFADENDMDLYFDWANEQTVRENSYHQESISYESHKKWFLDKIHHEAYFFYLFLDEKDDPIGQVRIQRMKENVASIGISIPPEARSKGLSVELLMIATEDFLAKFSADRICAYIKKQNQYSFHSFSKAGFVLDKTEPVEGVESYIMIKQCKPSG